MPPYSARGEGNQRKVHRAVLIGVERYADGRNDLPAVRRSLQLIAEALTAEGTGVLDRADVVFVPESPAAEADGTESGGTESGGTESGGTESGGTESGGTRAEGAEAEGTEADGARADAGRPEAVVVDPLQALAAVRAARDEVDGLLIVYFAGHGIVRPDGSDLHLLFTSSRVTRDRQNPFMDALSWGDHVMPELRQAKADWVVAILDCCFAGNALHSFTPAVRQSFALLTAAEPGVEIPPGDPVVGTEFTVALHRLLTGRTDAAEPLTFTRLVGEIRAEMAPLEAVDGHRWVPDERRHGDDVVLAVAPGSVEHDGPVMPLFIEPELKPSVDPASSVDEGSGPGRLDEVPSPLPEPGRWQRLRSRSLVPDPATMRDLPHRFRPRRNRMTALVLAGLLVLTGAGTWLAASMTGGDSADCAPPMELRVLTDPDIRATVQKAADAYPKRDGAGCRSVGITVYDVKATDAVAAFRSSSLWQEPPPACPASGDCLRPQRDLGAQPDIWIPAAGSAWQRVMADRPAATGATTATGATSGEADPGERVVAFEPLGPVAHTPMVLAVPNGMALVPALQTGTPLSTIVSALSQAQGKPISVLRPDPEGTDGALLATEALYASQGSGSVTGLEQSMAQALRPMPATAMALMCALADGSHVALADRAAVLVPEQTMARFNLSSRRESHPSCATDTLEAHTAQYPSDIPVLDLPFVRVTWAGADRDAEARKKAVTRFHDWLAEDPKAQKLFTGDGFRGVDKAGRAVPPADDSPLRADANERGVRAQLPPTTAKVTPASAASLGATLRRYRQALGPGQVLYLLDDSTSMTDKQVWDGPGRAKELISRSMISLGARDTYGVWSLAVEKGKKSADVVALGRHTRADAQRAVADTTTVNHNARIANGVSDALDVLRDGSAGADQPRLLVLVTDDEDTRAVTKKQLRKLLTEAGRAPLVRMVVVSLHSGGCTAGGFNKQITAVTGGRCLDVGDGDIQTELNAEVAKTGTGDAE